MNNRFVCARVSGPLGAPHLCLASSPHPGGGPVSAAGSLFPLPECPNDPRVGGQGSLADSLLISGACPGNISLGLNRRNASRSGGFSRRGPRPLRRDTPARVPEEDLLLGKRHVKSGGGESRPHSRTREGTGIGPFATGFGTCLQEKLGGLASALS